LYDNPKSKLILNKFSNVPLKTIKFDPFKLMKHISQHKSLGTDYFPDELLSDKDILEKLKKWAILKLNEQPLEEICNRGTYLIIKNGS